MEPWRQTTKLLLTTLVGLCMEPWHQLTGIVRGWQKALPPMVHMRLKLIWQHLFWRPSTTRMWTRENTKKKPWKIHSKQPWKIRRKNLVKKPFEKLSCFCFFVHYPISIIPFSKIHLSAVLSNSEILLKTFTIYKHLTNHTFVHLPKIFFYTTDLSFLREPMKISLNCFWENKYFTRRKTIARNKPPNLQYFLFWRPSSTHMWTRENTKKKSSEKIGGKILCQKK